jgi:hypothetical protein
MKKFKVKTQWIGYSEIIVNAPSKEDAENFFFERSSVAEKSTGNGLDYGYENEEIVDVWELKDE